MDKELLKKRARILWAHVKLQTYLLFVGMWKGECAWSFHVSGQLKRLWAAPPNHGTEHGLRCMTLGQVDTLVSDSKIFYREEL